jgi:hypothetical protein
MVSQVGLQPLVQKMADGETDQDGRGNIRPIRVFDPFFLVFPGTAFPLRPLRCVARRSIILVLFVILQVEADQVLFRLLVAEISPLPQVDFGIGILPNRSCGFLAL